MTVIDGSYIPETTRIGAHRIGALGIGASGLDALGVDALGANTSTSAFGIRRIGAAEWDRTVGTFDAICQEQTVAFAATRWPKLALEPLLFTCGGDTIGGALMMIQPLPLALRPVAICKWGPIARDTRGADHADLQRGMVEALIDEYARRRGMTLSILPRASAVADNPLAATLHACGFVVTGQLPFPQRYVVDLDLPDDAHRRKLNAKWRYHLSKAEKAKLVFEEAGVERLGEFDALYQAMSARKKFPDYSAYPTVPTLFAAENKALRPALFFVRHGDDIVAGAVIFKAGDTAAYLYGATNDAALPLRAGYLMHWEIIRWLKQNTNARWYDLGGSDGFMGLHQFKKQMVGDAGFIHPLPPMMHYAENRFSLALACAAFGLRDIARDLRQVVMRPFSNDARPDLKRGQAL